MGLESSDVSTTYSLLRNGSPTGSSLTGTYSALSFGKQTFAGTYTVEGSINNACPVTMQGSAIVSAVSPPVIDSDISDITVCSEKTAHLSITVSGQNLTYRWQLSYDANSPFSDIPPTAEGSGWTGILSNSLSIQNTYDLMTGNRYRCIVTNNYGCEAISQASKLTVIRSPYEIPKVTGGGTICGGGEGIEVGLESSESGITYSLLKDGAATGVSLPGKLCIIIRKTNSTRELIRLWHQIPTIVL